VAFDAALPFNMYTSWSGLKNVTSTTFEKTVSTNGNFTLSPTYSTVNQCHFFAFFKYLAISIV